MSILEVSHIEKRFRAAQVLNDISFTKETALTAFRQLAGLKTPYRRNVCKGRC